MTIEEKEIILKIIRNITVPMITNNDYPPGWWRGSFAMHLHEEWQHNKRKAYDEVNALYDGKLGGVWVIMPLPGNNIKDNWFMGGKFVNIDTLGDFIEKTEDFSGGYFLRDNDGNKLKMRISDKPGFIVIDKEGDGE